jgi:hypothetical protein
VSVQTPLGHQSREILGAVYLILFIFEQFGTVPAPAPTQHYWEETESLPRSPFFDLMRAWRKRDERLRTMLQAVKTVHSALNSFYGKLDDEQKAQFETFESAAGEPG